MVGPLNLTVESSVFKRLAKSHSTVVQNFKTNDWVETDTAAGGRLVYLEKNGVNITVARGLMGTLVFPSGPARGAFFGQEAVGFSVGKDKDEKRERVEREAKTGTAKKSQQPV